MTSARIVLTTIGQKQDADKLALQLVERRLAACVKGREFFRQDAPQNFTMDAAYLQWLLRH